MKKTVVSLLVLVLALAGMTAALALEADAVVGTWYLQELEVGGMSVSASGQSMEAIMTLLADGSGSLEMTDEDAEPATWAIAGDTLTVSTGTDASDAMDFAMVEGRLVAEMQGMKMFFGQEAPVAAETAPAVVVTELSQFDGNWTGAQISMQGMLVPLEMAGVTMDHSITDGLVRITLAVSGAERTFEVQCALVDGVLTGTPAADVNWGGDLQVILHEDDTISIPFASAGDQATIICARAE